MKKLLLLFFLSLATNLMAQKDTLYFNSAWNKVTTKADAAFFRILPLKKVGDLYAVKDYYINENLQMDGYWSNIEEETLEGKITWYHENGKIAVESQYKNGYRNGSSTHYTSGGFVRAKGVYKNDKFWTGTFLDFFRSNTPTAYEKGVLVAKLTFYKGSAQLAKKEVFENELVVKVLFFGRNGKSLGQIAYKDREPVTGKYVLFYTTNDEEATTIDTYLNYVDGNLSGEEIKLDNKGNIRTKGINKEDKHFSGTFYFNQKIRSYTNGQLEGKQTTYYTDSLINIKSYHHIVNQKKEGESAYFHKDGKKLAKGRYKDNNPWSGTFFDTYKNEISSYKEGEKHGMFIQYSNSGGIIQQQEFENGEIAKNTTYNNDKVYQLIYKKGKPYNGQEYSDYDSRLTTYKNGVKNGLFTENTYENVLIKGRYKDGLWDGTLTFEGKLHNKTTTCTYKEGKPVDGTIISDKCISTYKNGLKSGQESCNKRKYFNMEGNYQLVYDSITQQYKKGKLHGKIAYFKEQKQVNKGQYVNGSPYQGTFYVDKLFENFYKEGKLIKSTYYFGPYKKVAVFENGLITKEITYKDNSIVFEGDFKKGVEYNGTFIVLDKKGEPRRFTRTHYKNGKKHGKEQVINFIENKIEETNNYKKGIILQKIRKFPFKGIDSIIGVYKKGKPFSGHFYTVKSTIEKIEHYRKGIKTGYQYYYSTTGSLLKPVLDSINYVNRKPLDGIELEIVNRNFHKHFYKNGKRIHTDIFDIYYQGILDPPILHVVYTDKGFITSKFNSGASEKYNQLTYLNTDKTKGKVEFYDNKVEVGRLTFANRKIETINFETVKNGAEIKVYKKEPDTIVLEMKIGEQLITFHPDIKLPKSVDYNYFINFLGFLEDSDGTLFYHLDNTEKRYTSCTIKNGKPYHGILIYRYKEKEDNFHYKEYRNGEEYKEIENLTKKELLKLIKK